VSKLLHVCVQLVVEVVSFPSFGLMYVGGESLEFLVDVDVHVDVVVEDRRCRALPSHHKTRAKVSGK
jgi:hypothetical protein